MNYYLYRGHTLCAREVLPYEKLSALPAAGEVIFLFAGVFYSVRDAEQVK